MSTTSTTCRAWSSRTSRSGTRRPKRPKQIIIEEIDKFYRWIKSLDVVPTIIALRQECDGIRKAELARAMPSLQNLGPKEVKVIEAMTSAIVNKILHHPVTHLKQEANKIEGDLYIDTIRKLFDLTVDEEAARKAAQSSDD